MQVAGITASLFGSPTMELPAMFTQLARTTAVVGRVAFMFLLIVAALLTLRSVYIKKQPRTRYETWRCSYGSPMPKGRYSSRSYGRSLGLLFGFVAKTKRHYHEINKGELYPNYRKFAAFYFDFFELYLIKPIQTSTSWVLNQFQFIQNGRIQSYLIYSLVFILIVFLGTVWGLIK
jgi:hypothetical protein